MDIVGSDNTNCRKSRMIEFFLDICKGATIEINPGDPRNAVLAVCIASLKFVDREQLMKDILPDVYVDWCFVKVSKIGWV